MVLKVSLTNAVLALLVWFGQLYGVLPFSYQPDGFKPSTLRLWYCRSVALLLLLVNLWSYRKLLQEEIFPLLNTSYYLVVAQFVLNYTTVIVLYRQVIFNPSSLLCALNELVVQSQTILEFLFYSADGSPSSGPAVGKRLLVKVILVDIGICLSWNGAYLWHYRSASLSYIVAWWLSTFSTLQLVAVKNILLATLLWTYFLYGLINERVRLMIASILEVDENAQRWKKSPADRQFILTHIVRQLSGLQVHHSALTESIRNIVNFYNLPLALTLLYEFVIMISEVRQRFQYLMAINESLITSHINAMVSTHHRTLRRQLIAIVPPITMSYYDHVARALFRCTICLAQGAGFVPFAFSKRSNAFRSNNRLKLWCRCVAAGVVCTYPFVYHFLMREIPFPTLSIVYYLAWCQYVLNYGAIVFAHIYLLTERDTMLHALNGLSAIFASLSEHQPKSRKRKYTLKTVVKFVVVDAGIVAIFVSFYVQLFEPSLLSVLCWTLSMFFVYQLTILANVIVMVAHVCAYLCETVNVAMVQSRIRNRGGDGIQTWLNLYRQHLYITKSMGYIAQIVSIPLLCLVLSSFVIIISEIFYAYTSIVQGIRQGDEFFLAKYTSSFIFATFQAVQFYYIVSACADITEQAESTGVLLNEFLQTDVEPTVDRCIELFTIDLLHQDFKIKNCGLYYIDYTLLFSMIATITSYLIMLVQFQLAVV